MNLKKHISNLRIKIGQNCPKKIYDPNHQATKIQNLLY